MSLWSCPFLQKRPLGGILRYRESSNVSHRTNVFLRNTVQCVAPSESVRACAIAKARFPVPVNRHASVPYSKKPIHPRVQGEIDRAPRRNSNKTPAIESAMPNDRF